MIKNLDLVPSLLSEDEKYAMDSGTGVEVKLWRRRCSSRFPSLAALRD
jgi:hypothetical protein